MEISVTFRDHFLSIFQSAAADYARQLDGSVIAPPVRIRGFRSRTMSGRSFLEAANEVSAKRYRGERSFSRDAILKPLSTGADRSFNDTVQKAKTCATLGLEYLEALATGDPVRANVLLEEFNTSSCDVRWAKTLDEYFRYFGPAGNRREIPYVRPSKVGKNVIEIKADAEIAIVGDWGTGGAPARRVLKHVHKTNPDILIHLGDVYYSGTKKEYKENLIDVIAQELRQHNPDLAVFLLAGNHDMYCGGEGYYDAISVINPDPFKQKASFFCLRSADGSSQLIAMDTGLHDFSPFNVTNVLTFLEEEEQEWAIERIKEFSGQTILLSHHQLFSAFSQIGGSPSSQKLSEFNPHLLSSFRAFQNNGNISAWLWGHEHNLCIYREHLGLKRGRCVGHGAIPVFETDRPYTPIPDLANMPTLHENTKIGKDGNVFAHGFATISLRSGQVPLAQYFQIKNNISSIVFAEDLS